MNHLIGFEKVWLSGALLAALLALTASTGGALGMEQLAPEAQTVVAGNTAFALDLYAQLGKAEKGNLFFSPGSIHTALAMTYAGARGQTAAQMAKALHYGELVAEKLAAAYSPVLARLNAPRKDYDGTLAYDLVVANALWGQKGYPFRPEFLALNKKCYAAGLEELDFAQSEAARKTINDWVTQQTREKINNLIPEGVITNLTRLVLTNAVYFKSNWADKFMKAFTKDGPFRGAGAQPVQAPMMLRQGHYGYLEAADFQALEMPYRCYDLSMVVLLPRKDDGLPVVEQSLTPESLAAVVGKLANESVRVTFPKFKVECQFSLPKALQALEIGRAHV
jgi:serpin B